MASRVETPGMEKKCWRTAITEWGNEWCFVNYVRICLHIQMRKQHLNHTAWVWSSSKLFSPPPVTEKKQMLFKIINRPEVEWKPGLRAEVKRGTMREGDTAEMQSSASPLREPWRTWFCHQGCIACCWVFRPVDCHAPDHRGMGAA